MEIDITPFKIGQIVEVIDSKHIFYTGKRVKVIGYLDNTYDGYNIITVNMGLDGYQFAAKIRFNRKQLKKCKE